MIVGEKSIIYYLLWYLFSFVNLFWYNFVLVILSLPFIHVIINRYLVYSQILFCNLLTREKREKEWKEWKRVRKKVKEWEKSEKKSEKKVRVKE
jgi:hypothetical protein